FESELSCLQPEEVIQAQFGVEAAFLFVPPLRFNEEKPLGCSHPANFSRKKEATDMHLLLQFA
ncbi:hypothetical protein DBR06_SOUSAS610241, partial [Sousa chinensis]